ITIGYFQSIDEETDRTECEKNNIQIIRRITGGGAVFHATELTYSVIIPLDNALLPQSANDSYSVILTPVIETLRAHAIDAVHAPINDILVAGKKISGSAQIRRQGVLLQHGTIILDMDIHMAFACLTVPKEKNESHGITDPKTRVTTIREIIGDNALSQSFNIALRTGITGKFAEKFDAEFHRSDFTHNEWANAREIDCDLFSNPRWNQMRENKAGL
ncbi:MAG TPA: biotin/lipoate A/B protein ligase family protein, partial [Spirochaetota bacterium]